MPRSFGWLFASLVALATTASATPLVGHYWQPSGAPIDGNEAELALHAAIESRGGAMLPNSVIALAPPSLAPALDAALVHYRAFRFVETIAALTALEQTVEASGGGDLDAQQLSDLFLYRGLARLERNESDAAWSDLVRAARLLPSRTLDPAQIPSRPLAVFRRAAAEVASQPQSELEVRVPDGATVRVDGRPIGRVVAVALGRHLVHVTAPGFEPWSGSYVVNAGHDLLVPPLRAVPPPELDELAERARASGTTTGTLVAASLRRSSGEWRMTVRTLELATGSIRGEELPTGPRLGARVTAAIDRLLAPTLPPPAAIVAPPLSRSRSSRTWLWATLGTVGGVLVIVVPLGVVYGRGSSRGVVGGSLERLP